VATDLADYSQAVNVTGGSVAITGTATVVISGTPTVAISGTPSVNIANTPAVTISSGSVTIANANIAVINASGTKITSSRPPKVVGTLSIAANSTLTGTVTLDADVQVIVLLLPNALANYAHIKIIYHGISGVVTPVPFEAYVFAQGVFAFPILPVTLDNGGGQPTQIDIQIDSTVSGPARLEVVELFEPNPLWMQYFAPAFIAPNQAPLVAPKTLAANVSQWLIAPVANVRITLFEIVWLYLTNFGAGDDVIIGHAAAFPANHGASTGLLSNLAAPGSTLPWSHPYHGASLPRGEGVYVNCGLSAAGNFGAELNYSLD
jgi:hypothetical protein